MSYAVQTPVYEGPLDLLLQLILKEEVELWEISLCTIVDAFLAEVARLDGLDLETATEFLLIAATLVELKARRLLPQPEHFELDEELLRFEERDLLLARLLECKTFKDAANMLSACFDRTSKTVARNAGPEEPFRSLAPDPLESVSPRALHAAVSRALAPKPAPPAVSLAHVTQVRYTVREAVERVLDRLPGNEPVSFRSLVTDCDERLEIIVHFLAVLELYKQGFIDLEQIRTFGDLRVRRLTTDERDVDAVSLDDWEDESGASDTDAIVAAAHALGDDVVVIAEVPAPTLSPAIS
ncbi:MAG: segregation and condensation protein A [Acidimicrobiia bacterium]